MLTKPAEPASDPGLRTRFGLRARRCGSAVESLVALFVISSSPCSCLSVTPRFPPAHAIGVDHVVRPAWDSPASDRGAYRNRCTVVRHPPVGGTQRRCDLCAASA